MCDCCEVHELRAHVWELPESIWMSLVLLGVFFVVCLFVFFPGITDKASQSFELRSA